MALVGRRDGRNFGYGRQLSYAGPQALKDLFGGGHFATVKAHSDRWQAFVRWCRSEKDRATTMRGRLIGKHCCTMRIICPQQIEQGDLSIATAQNRLSSVNRTLAALRGDQYVKVPSPSQALGLQRSTIRSVAPQDQDRQHIERISKDLSNQGLHRVCAIVHLARETGMRLREAILADLPRLQREAEQQGRINIQDGAKGGRSGASAPRWITATEQVKSSLQIARNLSPNGSRNLLSRDESYLQFIRQVVRPAREILHNLDLRVFMNCVQPTPVNAMSRLPGTLPR